MSGKKIAGIILTILGLVGAYYYIGGYIQCKNDVAIGFYDEAMSGFASMFGMSGVCDGILQQYWPMMAASVAAIILGGYSILKDNEEEKNNSNKNHLPNKSSSVSTLIFDGERSLTNDAYKIYLVKKYSIEKNDALGKFIVSDKLFSSIEEALSYASGIDEVQISLDAKNVDNQNINYQTRKIFDSDDALKYGVTLNSDNGKFSYKGYSYDNFQEAINFAKSDLEKRISQTMKPDASSSLLLSDDDDLKRLHIIFKDGTFNFKNLSFKNRQDAINYADFDLSKQSGLTSTIDSNQNSMSDSSLKNEVHKEENLTKNGLIIITIMLLIGVPYYFYKTSEEKKAISALIAKSNQAFYECHNRKIKSSCAAQTKLSKELSAKGYCWSRADEVWFKCDR